MRNSEQSRGTPGQDDREQKNEPTGTQTRQDAARAALAEDESFRKFFTTSVVELPKNLQEGRLTADGYVDADAADGKGKRRGFFAGLFRAKTEDSGVRIPGKSAPEPEPEPEQPARAQEPEDMTTQIDLGLMPSEVREGGATGEIRFEMPEDKTPVGEIVFDTAQSGAPKQGKREKRAQKRAREKARREKETAAPPQKAESGTVAGDGAPATDAAKTEQTRAEARVLLSHTVDARALRSRMEAMDETERKALLDAILQESLTRQNGETANAPRTLGDAALLRESLTKQNGKRANAPRTLGDVAPLRESLTKQNGKTANAPRTLGDVAPAAQAGTTPSTPVETATRKAKKLPRSAPAVHVASLLDEALAEYAAKNAASAPKDSAAAPALTQSPGGEAAENGGEAQAADDTFAAVLRPAPRTTDAAESENARAPITTGTTDENAPALITTNAAGENARALIMTGAADENTRAPMATGAADENTRAPMATGATDENARAPIATGATGENAPALITTDAADENARAPMATDATGENASAPIATGTTDENARAPIAADVAGENAPAPIATGATGENAPALITTNAADENARAPIATGATGENARAPITTGATDENVCAPMATDATDAAARTERKTVSDAEIDAVLQAIAKEAAHRAKMRPPETPTPEKASDDLFAALLRPETPSDNPAAPPRETMPLETLPPETPPHEIAAPATAPQETDADDSLATVLHPMADTLPASEAAGETTDAAGAASGEPAPAAPLVEGTRPDNDTPPDDAVLLNDDALPDRDGPLSAKPKRPKFDPMRLFGTGDDETPQAEAPEPDAERETPFDAQEPREKTTRDGMEEYDDPAEAESVGNALKSMVASATLRCVLTGIFAGVLLMLSLMAQGVLPMAGVLDPRTAPQAFLGVNLLVLAAATVVSLSILRDGLCGLFKTPSPDCLPALADTAALLQLVLFLLAPDSYDPAKQTLFAGMAALLLFADTVGTRLRAVVVQGNFALTTSGVEHAAACTVKNKELLRRLSDGMEEDDPQILISRRTALMRGFLKSSFSPHASDRASTRLAYVLLAVGAVSAVITVTRGGSPAAAVTALAAVLCFGAPLSATLITAVPALLMQRAAGAVGAVIPGARDIEELGRVDVLTVDAATLFPPACAKLYGIKTFQKERIDLAILYATSVLIAGCNTLEGLFRGMIENKTEMLFPVKDLETRPGLGFQAWCDNCRILLGTREMLEQENVPLPAMDYENRFSKDGARQVLYLAVSGKLYAMFLLGYFGEKNVARSMAVLRRENIRLIVTCDDPTLTAARIETAYHLQEGFVKVLSADERRVLEPATAYETATEGCMLHLDGFASFVGGVKAAAGAADAEHAAGAVQLVSVIFSAIISLILLFSGTLNGIALVAALMYQLAWSALSIAVTLTKKY